MEQRLPPQGQSAVGSKRAVISCDTGSRRGIKEKCAIAWLVLSFDGFVRLALLGATWRFSRGQLVDVNLDSIAGKLARIAFVLGVVLLGATSSILGQTIDVSLNLDYANNADPDSGGTWQLAVKTSDFGLAGLTVNLEGISGTDDIMYVGPSGVVNLNEEYAGLVLDTAATETAVDLAFQIEPPSLTGGEHPWFFGVGSIDNDPDGAAPNHAAKPASAASIGPEITTLNNVQNGLWGTGDFLDDPDWAHAAILAVGTFLPGQTPAFFSDPPGTVNEGRVFDQLLATSDEAIVAAPISAAVSPTLIVRDDLGDLAPGDYNGDGFVNLADYSVWRDTLGAAVSVGTGADGMPDGVIDSQDYGVWKTHFGTTPASATLPAAHSGAVPEPQSVVVAALAALLGSLAVVVRKRTQETESIN